MAENSKNALHGTQLTGLRPKKTFLSRSSKKLQIWHGTTHMHKLAAQTKFKSAGTVTQAPRRKSRPQSPSFTHLLLPIHKSETSRAGLSEEQCLCVIVIFHFHFLILTIPIGLILLPEAFKLSF